MCVTPANVVIYFHSCTKLHYLFKEFERINGDERKYIKSDAVLQYTQTFHNKLLIKSYCRLIIFNTSSLFLTDSIINV